MIKLKKILNEISQPKKIINQVFRKNGIKRVVSHTTGIRGYSRTSGTGYQHEYDGLVSIIGFSKNEIKELASQIEKAGVKVHSFTDGSIEYEW